MKLSEAGKVCFVDNAFYSIDIYYALPSTCNQLANQGGLIQFINVAHKNDMPGRWDMLIGLFFERRISGVCLIRGHTRSPQLVDLALLLRSLMSLNLTSLRPFSLNAFVFVITHF